MMPDTPRAFVGTVTLSVAGLCDADTAAAVAEQLTRLPGVRMAAYDAGAGSVSVTAELPVDRAEVVAAVERAGCRVRQ